MNIDIDLKQHQHDLKEYVRLLNIKRSYESKLKQQKKKICQVYRANRLLAHKVKDESREQVHVFKFGKQSRKNPLTIPLMKELYMNWALRYQNNKTEYQHKIDIERFIHFIELNIGYNEWEDVIIRVEKLRDDIIACKKIKQEFNKNLNRQ